MNWYFYKIFVPLCFLWILALLGYFLEIIHFNPFIVSISWFLIGPLGIGVGFHKLFSHRQFETYRFVEVTLALFGTLACYAPVLFWATNHIYHHKNSDEESDSSSPAHFGFWESFLWYRLRKNVLDRTDVKNYCARRLLKDPVLRWMSRHFIQINLTAILVLMAFDFEVLVNFYLLPVFFEHLRINLVSSLSHLKIPFSYRNYDTKDQSYNHLILGFLTFGFAWHNNHHHDERKLVLTKKWWEMDVEGMIATCLNTSKSPVLSAKSWSANDR